jgi:hypothetical protein
VPHKRQRRNLGRPGFPAWVHRIARLRVCIVATRREPHLHKLIAALDAAQACQAGCSGLGHNALARGRERASEPRPAPCLMQRSEGGARRRGRRHARYPRGVPPFIGSRGQVEEGAPAQLMPKAVPKKNSIFPRAPSKKKNSILR